jgi:hypothetical protein
MNMPPEIKIDCATKKHLSLNESHMQLLQGIRCLRVTISFVCHQKPHSVQPNQIYGNLHSNEYPSIIGSNLFLTRLYIILLIYIN